MWKWLWIIWKEPGNICLNLHFNLKWICNCYNWSGSQTLLFMGWFFLSNVFWYFKIISNIQTILALPWHSYCVCSDTLLSLEFCLSFSIYFKPFIPQDTFSYSQTSLISSFVEFIKYYFFFLLCHIAKFFFLSSF